MTQYHEPSYSGILPSNHSQHTAWTYHDLFEFVDLDGSTVPAAANSHYSPSTESSAEEAHDGATTAADTDAMNLSSESLAELETRLLEALRPCVSATLDSAVEEQGCGIAAKSVSDADFDLFGLEIPQSPASPACDAYLMSAPASPSLPRTPCQSPCTPAAERYELSAARTPVLGKTGFATPCKIGKSRSRSRSRTGPRHAGSESRRPSAERRGRVKNGHRSWRCYAGDLFGEALPTVPTSLQQLGLGRQKHALSGRQHYQQADLLAQSSSMPNLSNGLDIHGGTLDPHSAFPPNMYSMTAPAVAHINGYPRSFIHAHHRYASTGHWIPPASMSPTMLHHNPTGAHAQPGISGCAWFPQLPQSPNHRQTFPSPGLNFGLVTDSQNETPRATNSKLRVAHHKSSLHNHRRHKSAGVTGQRTSGSASQIRPLGFVNYTPSDGSKILNGVAPSGSSKTKARREKEAEERMKRQIEAVKRAVERGGAAGQLFDANGTESEAFSV